MKKRIALVYQAGIANVFQVKNFNTIQTGERKLLRQADFRACESFALGCSAMGAQVKTFACNQAGDIQNSEWSTVLENAPFNKDFRPINTNL